ncbi:E3 ubiquitin-protein ligase siah-1-like [Zootermopsis nevadensis]|uniref:E3 ubiquitin-protein ligase n=1 Tax=Zootermopsis nevadensis TaxID=136037 RepID=A0A067QGD9_ZOONE|nr:E3 ubiquitin-protein ligase siah-1-like [Zootermopsis nevadensis]XP_021940840.1 E3 ubiquitin-protein ligase siah-1-like [Zootermopsis nevadensis]KDR07292.1 E3 ubiquitin-protein ligase sina [Zootermopsis nevadensis]
MDTLVRDFDEALLNDLECPVCTEYMSPPITLCSNGHNICKKCRQNVECCPICRGQLSGIRNVTLEKIARRQQYPCTNRDRGCPQVFSMDLIADHHAVCRYGPLRCPMNKFPSVSCSWKGLLSEIKKHVQDSHEAYFKDTPYVRSHYVGNGEAVRFITNETFLCYKRIKDDKLFCVVQLVGTKEEASKYKSQFTLCGGNGVDKIVETFVVRSFTEDFCESFQSGKCLILDDRVIRNFVVDGKLNLTISVSTIEK